MSRDMYENNDDNAKNGHNIDSNNDNNDASNHNNNGNDSNHIIITINILRTFAGRAPVPKLTAWMSEGLTQACYCL